MKKKKGFTLVELLAVIVILAVILIVAVPSVINIIEDSRKSILESTVKMIASAAEKKKMENDVLGKVEKITCENVAKLNNIDYANCSVDFVGNTAIILIEGKGNFKGLNVCGGTKNDVDVVIEDCNTYSIEQTGVNYIEKLLLEEETVENKNGLKQVNLTIDSTSVDAGIRYVGNDVNNYVYFNCDDTDSKGTRYSGKGYNYNESCEKWRIVGVFDVASEIDGVKEPRIKIIREENLIDASWDSSAENVDGGMGINQWGESKYNDGSIYEGADLMLFLNETYLGKTGKCKYCNDYSQATCTQSCDVKMISKSSSDMIDEVVWDMGARTAATRLSIAGMYKAERSTSSSNICSGKDACNDNVVRTSKWKGKVGLMYSTDYALASADSKCANDIYGADSTCENDNWMHPTSGDYWTMTSYANASYSVNIWALNAQNCIGHYTAFSARGVKPTLYLKPNIRIIGGNGGSIPFMLGFGKN